MRHALPLIQEFGAKDESKNISMKIDDERFARGHQAFLAHMEANGEPFTNFSHPFLIDDEIAYKWEAYSRASKALQLNRWKSWLSKRGEIIGALKKACSSTISNNLLEHRYGRRGYSETALYRVESPDEIKGLERQLFQFFLGGDTEPESIGPRFDQLASYLMTNRLGCNWAFLAYLAFLVAPHRYFPIRPSRFDTLLDFYGVGRSVSGRISWDRYEVLLELADLLRLKLLVYGDADAVEVQSYMWVVSYLLEKGKVPDQEDFISVDYEDELAARTQAAKRRERIGLLGERFVVENERRRLIHLGRGDLAGQVRLVSAEDSSLGYDVVSFNDHGEELHIEVKSTSRARTSEVEFWLSENERHQGEKDRSWTVFRVWDIGNSPSVEDLGNLIQKPAGTWSLTSSSWRVQGRKDAC